MFKKLRIAAKLFLGFGAILLLLVTGSGISAISGLKSASSLASLERVKSNEVFERQVEQRITQGRLQAWLALGTGDMNHWKLSDDAFKQASELLEELATQTGDSKRLAEVRQMAELVKSYRETVIPFRSLTGGNPALQTPENKAAYAISFKVGSAITAATEALGQSFKSNAKDIESQAESTAHFLVILTISIGIVSLLTGLGLSFLISESIRLPVVNLTRVMGALAKGDLSVPVPNTTEPNEIGEMARSVMVFKENAMERQQLETVAAANRAEADAERERSAAERTKAANEQAEAVRRLGEGLKNVASGDLRVQLSEGFSDKYAQIKDDFNEAIDKLKGTMLAVIASTDAIQKGTQEISTASDDLSRRTEQQAASLEETAAALDEITATVKRSAEGATHARQVVAAADDDAKKSAIVVRQTVEAMDAIAKSSQQISQIIGVIDEIAFQTNLLALNAGVEAARAGDAGRGFAVVASEVRALAQRSAEAAKEIKGLISASTTQVTTGVQLVAETGKSLERIMAQVKDINNVVSEIATGSKEQAAGLAEVNTAINQMDQMTQQNVAMVEESTAASHSLSQEMSQLSGLIAHFQVGQAGGAASMRRPSPASSQARNVPTRLAS